MVKALIVVTCALVLALGVVPLAQADDIKGTIVKIEQPAKVVVLDDGRMFQVKKETVFMIESKPVTFTQLQPGKVVVIQSGVPVQFKDGKYIIIEGAPSALPRSN